MVYNDASIKSLDIIDHIKQRPSAYIEDIGINGQYKSIKEGIDNALDELENIKYSKNNTLSLSIIYNKNNLSKYIVSIIDNGRGIPINKVVDVFTKEYTSGKFDTNSYTTSGGLLGIGSKVIYALSDIFNAISINNKKISILFNNSITTQSETDYNVPNFYKDIIFNKNTGVILQFQLSTKFFRDIDNWIKFGYLELFTLLRKISLLKFNKFRIVCNLIEVNNNKIFSNFNKYHEIDDPNISVLNYLQNIPHAHQILILL